MEKVVYHVSDNENHDKSGIYAPRAFRLRYPYVYKMFTERDTDYVQFDSGSGNVIVSEEPRSDFKDHVITHS